MLQTAQALCRLSGEMLGGPFDPLSLKSAAVQAQLHSKIGQLLTDNGDAELWSRLCTLNNPAPIHVIRVVGDGADTYRLSFTASDNYFGDKYPSGAVVGDGTGRVQASYTASNDTPWCVVVPTDAGQKTWFDQQSALPSKGPGDPNPKLPPCPDGFVKDDNRFKGGYTDSNGNYLYGDIDDWSARGAINAGQSVFVYLDQMISKGNGRALRYDEL